MEGTYYFSGNDAAAEGALAGGCRFYAGYPITPTSDLMERMAVRLPEVGGVFVQMEDEIASISAVIGAAWAGAKAMTATSGPGFSLMQEAIGYAAFTETPCVIVDVQRAGPCTGQATKVGAGDVMQAKWGSHGDYQVIALSPWSVQEMYDLAIRAFNLSERFRVPAILLAEEALAHLRETVKIAPGVEIWDRPKGAGAPPFDTDEEDGVPPMPAFGEGERLAVTGSTHDPRGFRKTDDPDVHARLVARINEKVLRQRHCIGETESYFLEDARDRSHRLRIYGKDEPLCRETAEEGRVEGGPFAPQDPLALSAGTGRAGCRGGEKDAGSRDEPGPGGRGGEKICPMRRGRAGANQRSGASRRSIEDALRRMLP